MFLGSKAAALTMAEKVGAWLMAGRRTVPDGAERDFADSPRGQERSSGRQFSSGTLCDETTLLSRVLGALRGESLSSIGAPAAPRALTR